MIYQLPNGKAIEMSVEQYFKMSDDDFNYLMASNAGEELSDPFAKSVIRRGEITPDTIDEIDPEELTEDELRELELILNKEEGFDADFIDFDNLEQ